MKFKIKTFSLFSLIFCQTCAYSGPEWFSKISSPLQGWFDTSLPKEIEKIDPDLEAAYADENHVMLEKLCRKHSNKNTPICKDIGKENMRILDCAFLGETDTKKRDEVKKLLADAGFDDPVAIFKNPSKVCRNIDHKKANDNKVFEKCSCHGVVKAIALQDMSLMIDLGLL